MDGIELELTSPCRRLCQLSARRVCTGCGRTVDEIAGWRSMTVQQKQDCADAAAARMDLMDVDDLMME